jgi:hypothetical protein
MSTRRNRYRKFRFSCVGFERKRIDAEAGILQADVQIGPAEGPRQHLVAAAEVEDDGEGLVLLYGLQEETKSRKDFA